MCRGLFGQSITTAADSSAAVARRRGGVKRGAAISRLAVQWETTDSPLPISHERPTASAKKKTPLIQLINSAKNAPPRVVAEPSLLFFLNDVFFLNPFSVNIEDENGVRDEDVEPRAAVQVADEAV